jgi:thiamine-monophosphate kinase
MQELKKILENKIISDLTKSLKRSPNQMNKVHESDAEIIRLKNSTYDLAITIDTISEEIKSGLYSDPYQIGWMSVIVNMSDLAAVGADPLGILISQIFPKKFTEEFVKQIQKGINDACKKCGTFVLGGDTNFGDDLIISGCAIGRLDKKKYLHRVGCNVGDKIFVTGKTGIGNAFAFNKLFNKQNETMDYKPSAKLEWRALLLKYAACCIDTSDGIISSLDQLIRLNKLGFRFRTDWYKITDNNSKVLFESYNLPLWILLAGEHGEFELLFSIPTKNEKRFLMEASKLNLKPLYLGEVIKKNDLLINIYDKEQTLDTEKIRNLAFDKNFTPKQYLQKLLEIDIFLKQS